ncbi:type IV pilus inner membrane component PilO [Natronospira bacteriovora]|uniref:Type 4a pilus biogenesis protein PilO n=1 Tax=Natronospira bacteriovora TaxID=3069753 RepID=A0ABU0W8H3_9GAMM|nr:type 4a pilus biogenesis protein PilO [Natronospira sp. AB-CW4]MDQ2070208.1 type 4a pilus biogenesis protein PilO [Natronospira sp. AB-CW4]
MDLRKLNEIDINDLRNIDFSDMAEWPVAGRMVMVAIIVAGVVAGGYFFHIQDQLERLERLERQERELRTQFESRQERAANLDDYKNQLDEMRASFGTMLRQLPGEAEVPALLIDISETAAASGLESDLFEPRPPVERDFYAELPYRLRLRGTYHEFGQFANDVAKLPRIVTLHDIRIRPRDGGELEVEMIAKTYRYLGEDDGGL